MIGNSFPLTIVTVSVCVVLAYTIMHVAVTQNRAKEIRGRPASYFASLSKEKSDTDYEYEDEPEPIVVQPLSSWLYFWGNSEKTPSKKDVDEEDDDDEDNNQPSVGSSFVNPVSSLCHKIISFVTNSEEEYEEEKVVKLKSSQDDNSWHKFWHWRLWGGNKDPVPTQADPKPESGGDTNKGSRSSKSSFSIFSYFWAPDTPSEPTSKPVVTGGGSTDIPWWRSVLSWTGISTSVQNTKEGNSAKEVYDPTRNVKSPTKIITSYKDHLKRTGKHDTGDAFRITSFLQAAFEPATARSEGNGGFWRTVLSYFF